MFSYYVLYFVAIFQGSHSIKFLIEEAGRACILEYADSSDDTNELQPLDRKCVQFFDDDFHHVIYNYSRRSLFYAKYEQHVEENDVGPIIVVESPISLGTPRNIFINNDLRKLSALAIDWIHDTIYILEDNVMSVPMTKFGGNVIAKNVVIKTDLYKPCHKRFVEIKDVQIDPYTSAMFVLVESEDQHSDRFVVAADLNGEDLELIIGESNVLYKDAKLTIDISETNLYVSSRNKIYIYDYVGDLKAVKQTSGYILHFSVFGNKLYIFSNSTDSKHLKIRETDLNQTKEILETTQTYVISTPFVKFKLLDARMQRQKRNGRYVCDRTDCEDLCEVSPSGESCLCRETATKGRDGLCYMCGHSNVNSSAVEPTIINGIPSYPANFPWHAVLYRASDLLAICGGTLLTSSVVLTAAHCVTSDDGHYIPTALRPETFKVALGKTHRAWNATEPTTRKRNVRRIVAHKDYKGSTFNYAQDIALLFLANKVILNSYIMPACLDYNGNQLPSNKNFTGHVAGFGYTEECGALCSSTSDVLLYTTAPVMSFVDCYNATTLLDPTLFHKISSDKVCIGNGSASAVQKGDSGGGLTRVHKGLHYVVGVVSDKHMKMDGDSVQYSFGAFTNVNMYMDWIKRHLPAKD